MDGNGVLEVAISATMASGEIEAIVGLYGDTAWELVVHLNVETACQDRAKLRRRMSDFDINLLITSNN